MYAYTVAAHGAQGRTLHAAIADLVVGRSDGIMSAIDFFLDVGTTTGAAGEKRVVITFNGKFLPFIEQEASKNGAPSPRD